MDGAKYERELKKMLSDEGYLVMRAAGSMGDAGDLAVIPPVSKGSTTYLIEVKSTRKEQYYTSSDKEQYKQMQKIASRYNCLPIYIVRFIDDSNKKQWEIYYTDEDIYRKNEGIRFDKFF